MLKPLKTEACMGGKLSGNIQRNMRHQGALLNISWASSRKHQIAKGSVCGAISQQSSSWNRGRQRRITQGQAACWKVLETSWWWNLASLTGSYTLSKFFCSWMCRAAGRTWNRRRMVGRQWRQLPLVGKQGRPLPLVGRQ